MIVSIAVVIALAIKYWYIVVSAVIVLLAFLIIAIRVSVRREEEEARRQEEAVQKWLSEPPPPLDVPARFTDKWFREHIPTMHPGQVPALVEALHARDWTDARIAKRIDPYLEANPYYGTSEHGAGEDKAVSEVIRSPIDRKEPQERPAAPVKDPDVTCPTCGYVNAGSPRRCHKCATIL